MRSMKTMHFKLKETSLVLFCLIFFVCKLEACSSQSSPSQTETSLISTSKFQSTKFKTTVLVKTTTTFEIKETIINSFILNNQQSLDLIRLCGFSSSNIATKFYFITC